MPTYQFEAMDATGQEVKDVIEAASEDEAQTTIRQMGYFVTKISVKKGAGAASEAAAKKKRGFAFGTVPRKAPVRLHTPVVHFAGRRPADSPQPADSRRTSQGGAAQELADGCLRRDRRGFHAVGGHGEVAQDVQPAVRQHDQGRRGGRCPGSDSAASGGLHGTGGKPQAKGQGRHDLSGRGRDGGRRHFDLHHAARSCRCSRKCSTSSI